MQADEGSRLLEQEICSLLSKFHFLTAAELAQNLQITREEVHSRLQSLLIERHIACVRESAGMLFYRYSAAETQVLRALDEARGPLSMQGISTALPRPVIARALLALLKAGTVESEPTEGGELPRFRSLPCEVLE